ncbi:hypothetical protein BJY52DRAFT_128161 [Lactarius psammicola]|nr:hypothetical protein BJY52DRAFT_128161 [Lactarius psammicola]
MDCLVLSFVCNRWNLKPIWKRPNLDICPSFRLKHANIITVFVNPYAQIIGKPLWLDSKAVTVDEIIGLSVVRTAHLAATSDIKLQQQAPRCSNTLLNHGIRTNGWFLWEKNTGSYSQACIALLGIMRSCRHLSVGSSQADINRNMCMKTGFSPSGYGAFALGVDKSPFHLCRWCSGHFQHSGPSAVN